MKIEKNGPEVVLSTMTTGLSRILFNTNIAIEVDHFRVYQQFPRNTIAAHATLHPDTKSLWAMTREKISPIDKVKRFEISRRMQTVEETIARLSMTDNDPFLIVHGETAAYLLDRIRGGKISIPPTIKVLVENDDKDGQSGYYLHREFPGKDATNPSTVRLIATELSEAIQSEVGAVLDVDHLENSHPRMLLSEAKCAIGNPTYVHVSGLLHRGRSIREIREIAATLEPEIIVLEGPIPVAPNIAAGLLLPSHRARLRNMVFALTGEELKI